ncbi:Uncharacterised protein [Neisseria meningitidis]|nr:Uncharacterised protein [Neisseria meningitidis]CWS63174.1 Uncharacterised protein [Neisseria meningitidis]
MSVHRFQRNAQTAFPLKYCPDTRTRGVFIVPRHRPPNAQRVHIRPKRFRLFVIQHQLRRIGNGVVKAVFSKHIAQVVHIGKHHAAAFNAVFFQTAFQFGKSVAPEAGKKQQPVRLQGARPVVQHRKDLFRRQQSEIRPQHISTRFGQRRDRGLAVLHHALTRKPLPKTAFAGGSGSRQKVRTGIVFFKYRLRIAFRQQAAADVRIRTGKQDILGRVADECQALVGIFGEMAVNLPAFVLRIHVKPLQQSRGTARQTLPHGSKTARVPPFPSQPACCLSNAGADTRPYAAA